MRFLFCLLRDSPQWVRTSLFKMFLDHTKRRTTVGRAPQDEWSAHRKVQYLTTHNTHDIRAHGGIRTHSLSRRAAADLRLRPRSQRERLKLRSKVKCNWCFGRAGFSTVILKLNTRCSFEQLLIFFPDHKTQLPKTQHSLYTLQILPWQITSSIELHILPSEEWQNKRIL